MVKMENAEVLVVGQASVEILKYLVQLSKMLIQLQIMEKMELEEREGKEEMEHQMGKYWEGIINFSVVGEKKIVLRVMGNLNQDKKEKITKIK
jgi:hypothetical protein